MGVTFPSRISWNAKGGIFTGASVIGVGEDGDEAVVPLSNKAKMLPFAQAVASMIGNSGGNGNGGGQVINNFTVQATVREEADIRKVAEDLYKLQQRSQRGQGRSVIV
jgi:hypothetical protein